MNVQAHIDTYIAGLAEPKRSELLELHQLTRNISPECTLWFLDGTNEKGKVVSNPNIGYGTYTIRYADGSEKDFYRVGISANTTGISVYIMGLADKTFLTKTYGEKLGKASVTGYCVKFKTLKDINIDVLEQAIRDRLEM